MVFSAKQSTKVNAIAAPDKKSKSKGIKKIKRSGENYNVYAYRVLKQVHPDTGISKRCMSIMNSFVTDIFDKIMQEASTIARYNKKPTLTSKEI